MPMNRFRNISKILDAFYDSTTEIVSDDYYTPRGAQKLSLYCLSTRAGTLAIYYLDMAGSERVVQSIGLDQNALSVVDIDYPMPRMRTKFTPTASTAGNVTIEVYSA